MSRWQIFVDTGGTFTDAIGISPTGSIHRAKVLSSGELRTTAPDGSITRTQTGLEPPLVAAHQLTGTPLGEALPDLAMRIATTRATNALLTRTGTRPVLFTTTGFEDIVHIGNQQRPELFALAITKPKPFPDTVVGVVERLNAKGGCVQPLDEVALRDAATNVLAAGHAPVAAVSLLHSSTNPEHEQRVAAILRDVGFTTISCASDLTSGIGFVDRTMTACIDAYLSPMMSAYFNGVAAALPDGSHLHVMASSGTLVPVARIRARDCLLSGPAGGVVGAARAALDAGFDKAIGVDMGGTSTDVCRIENGQVPLSRKQTVGDATLLSPSAELVTVAAGGGSICSLDHTGMLRVGPASAGANPGPACYGLGGPLTITDIHLLLGRIDATKFGIPLDFQAAESALQRLMDDIAAAGHPVTDSHALCEGLLVLANDTMADAIRGVTLRQGIALDGHALIAFGGAGGLHGAQLAERLGLDTVVIPPDAGLLSARGLAATGLARTLEQLVAAPVDEGDLWKRAMTQQADAKAGLITDGSDSNATLVTTHTAYCQIAGQEAVFPIALTDGCSIAAAFTDIYTQTFGSPPPANRALLCDTLVTTVREADGTPITDVPDALPFPNGASGPLAITLPHSAFFVPGGWQVNEHASGAIILKRSGGASIVSSGEPAVVAALWSRRFAAIADAMGDTLQRTALSVNVRDRLDYSCAVLDPSGRLVATAAHIPVHLGALGACVRALLQADAFVQGDELVVNHPAFGGSHLPDVTLVTCVTDDAGTVCGFVASRAHYAELGGSRPGSMPPRATTLIEEGVVLPPMPYDTERIASKLMGGPYPSRAVSDNLADLAAQRAANREGALQLAGVVQRYGIDAVAQQQEQLARRAQDATRRALARIRPAAGKLHGISVLEHPSGPQSYVVVTLRWPENLADADDTVEIDFSGTSGQVNGNLNAPLAVTQAAVLYVLRLLVADDIPLSDGILDAIRLVVPSGTFINPLFSEDPALCPAVVGGNTEVSQRIVDALLDAIGICASSQGTMNNILFGNDHFSVYETIAGGSGAVRGQRGADGVHVHMTNTRITDPEVLERRIPVRLVQFRLVPGSGGKGKWRGGCGVRREWEFLEDVQVSVITQSRIFAPRGRAGGGPGRLGLQWVRHKSGATTVLGCVNQVDCAAGERLIVETPGGGGWGPDSETL